ncbi:crustacean hyperglycemic hormones-like isoform X1 [Ornithodoros turicata]|uniref:crustacean hyperglycemic hormones-like isoform X1 n=1 Tax=Ornithodoros turicata TaxID=34597 RepID=UPI0031398935
MRGHYPSLIQVCSTILIKMNASLTVCLRVLVLLVAIWNGVQAQRNLHKRSFLELGCRGNFEQSYLARLERVCEECFQLYREPQVYNMCRVNCFKNENFGKCAEALLLHDEMESLKNKVDYLYSS